MSRSHDGPHVGTDTFRKVVKTNAPMRLDSQGRALLTCELEGCRHAYSVQHITAKERLKKVALRAMIVAAILVAAALIAQLGTWVYGRGLDSQGLRILGSGLTGAGVIIYFLIALWSLMSFWFWPDRYKLQPAKADGESAEPPATTRRSDPDVYAGHSVKLRRAKP